MRGSYDIFGRKVERVMSLMRKKLWPILGLAVLTACAESQAFRQGREEEALNHWDLAVLRYARAVDLDRSNSEYRIALARAKIKASQFHFEKGKLYRSSGRPELAIVELEQAVVLDPTNQYADSELHKAHEDAAKLAAERAGDTKLESMKKKARGQKARAPMLEPASDKPVNLNFPQPRPIKQIYQALASAAGINIIFDPQLKDENVSIVLTNINFQNALETLIRQENHFYKVVDEKTILIAADTPQNRKNYEDLVLRTFYLSNGDITDVSNALRNLLQSTRIYPNKAENSITLRDTADKVAIAEKIIEQNDKQLSEVVIDIELLQIGTEKLQDLGLLLNNYSISAGIPAPGGTTDLGAALPANTFSWDQLSQITQRSFAFTLPSTVTLNFIKNNTDAELLAKPQLRISEGQKAQLIIGDKTPIPTTTFNTANTVGGNIVPITSFQYQDVGIKIDVEPRVHHNKEITLKLTIEVSNLNGFVSQQGQNQPIIGTRTITSNIRLKDGETNFLAGLYRTDKSSSADTIPFLGDIPVLGRLFTRKKLDNKVTDLVLTLTPHIIRIPDITEEDLAPLYVGTDQNISFQGTPRIETPGAAGPFDQQRRDLPPPVVTPHAAPTPAPVNLVPNAFPNDPFRSSPPPRDAVPPQPTPPPAQPFAMSTVPSVTFDLDPPAPVLGPGQQQVVRIRATGAVAGAILPSTTLSLRFDPSIVSALSVRPVLGDNGQADARVEPGKVTVEVPGGVALSGTSTVAEITLQGVAPGHSALAFDNMPADQTVQTNGSVEVR
jgi:general secretion pathway protein D